MSYTRYNISKPKKYVKDGVEKTQWNTIGTYTEFTKPDGSISRLIEIHALGLEANVFPIAPKEQASAGTPNAEAPTDEIDPNDIPY